MDNVTHDAASVLDRLDLAAGGPDVCLPGWYTVEGTHGTVYLFQVRAGETTRVWRILGRGSPSRFDQESGWLLSVRTVPEVAAPGVLMLGHRHVIEWDPGPLSCQTQWRLATEVTRIERVTSAAAESLRARMPLYELVDGVLETIAAGGLPLEVLRRAVLVLARTVRDTAKGGGPYASDAELRGLAAWREHVTSYRMDREVPVPLYRCGQAVARWAWSGGRGNLEQIAKALLKDLPPSPFIDPEAPFPRAVRRAYTVLIEGVGAACGDQDDGETLDG